MTHETDQLRLFMPAKDAAYELRTVSDEFKLIPPHILTLELPRRRYANRRYPEAYVAALAAYPQWKQHKGTPAALEAADDFAQTEQAHITINAIKLLFQEKAERLASVPAHAGQLALRDLAELAELNVTTAQRWHYERMLKGTGAHSPDKPVSEVMLPIEELDKVLHWQEPLNYDPTQD